MTCQCTCGKHILIDRTPPFTVQNAAAAAAPFPVTFQANTGALPTQFVDVVPNAACAAPAVPHSLSIRP